MAKFRTALTKTVTREVLNTEAIVAAYLEGKDVTEIAREANCSREAIYVHLRRGGITKQNRHQREVDDAREAAYGLYLNGIAINDIRKILGITYTTALHLSREFSTDDELRRLHHLRSHSKRGSGRDYTAGQLRRAIKQFHKQTGLTGISSYEKWRNKRGTLPHSLTITNRFGSWTKALESCDLTPNRRPTGMGLPQYQEADFRAALMRVWDQTGNIPTYNDYSEHFRRGEEPTPETFRQRYRTWGTALEHLLGDIFAANFADSRE